MSPIKYPYTILLVILQTTYVFCQIQQTAFLAPNKWEFSDLLFEKGENTKYTVPLNASKWNITVNNQRGSDIQIRLGETWGFHPSIPSTINLIINGSTPNHTFHTHGSVLFIFNVDDQYFTTSAHLDNSRNAFKVYPPNNQSLATADIHDMIYVDTRPRAIRFSQNNASIATTSTGTAFQDPAIWPMFITIINDPIKNTLTYQWRDAMNPNIVSVIYNNAFSSNSGFDIHISGDSPGDSFIISSINISYIFNETDLNTDIPTNIPSNIPTTTPTNVANTIPSNIPSVNPTNIPTTIPSNIPSIIPTNIPTTIPSNIPSILPSNIPSTIPTNTPSIFPSNIPSTIPTNIPTAMPTLVSTDTTNSIMTTSKAPSRAPIYSGLYTSSTTTTDITYPMTTESISVSNTNSTESLQLSTNSATTDKPTTNATTTTSKESITSSSIQTTLRTSDHHNTTNLSELLQTTSKSTVIPSLYPANSIKPSRPTTADIIIEATSKDTLNSTQSEDREDTSMEDTDNIPMALNNMVTYMIIGGMFLCGICCLIAGIRIGITYYKRKLNGNDTDEQPPDIEKQLSSNCVDNPKVSPIHRNIDESNESHESMYVSDEQLFEQNDINTPETQKNSDPTFNIKFNSESLQQQGHEQGDDKLERGEIDMLQQQKSLSYIIDDMRTTKGNDMRTTKGNDMMLKQKTISSIIDNYDTLRIEYNVSDNNGYPDEGIQISNV